MDKVVLDNFKYSVSFISPRIRILLENLGEHIIDDIQEIRLRRNKPVTLVTKSGCCFLTNNSRTTYILSANCVITSENEIIDTVNKMCNYSMHSHQKEIENGYITLNNGARVGVAGTALTNNGEVSNVKDIISINLRIPRNIKNVSEPIFEQIFSKNICNLIIAGPPSSGKTTLLKDIAYNLSSGRMGKYYKVCIIDERKELASQERFTGPNTDVLYGFPKEQGISVAVRTLSPDFIICDEIGSADEAKRIINTMNSGVKFILSIHSADEDELKRKIQFRILVESGGFDTAVILSGSNNPCHIKEIVKADEMSGELFLYSVNSYGKLPCGNLFEYAN